MKWKIPLARLNVTIGVAKLERISKTDSAMKPLIEAARASVAPPRSCKRSGRPRRSSSPHSWPDAL